MSKLKNMAVFSAMLVGVMIYTSPAKSAVCFLPDDDGSCGGGDIEISDGSDSDDNKKEEKCEGFPVSATEYEKMKNCFDFTSCTKSKTKEVKYKKGAQKENTTWSNGICCTNGEKYFSKQGQCCPTTGCTCSGGRVWNPSTEQCECPEGKEFVGGVCTCAGNTVPDSNGNCILPASCTYEYRQATTEDSCGLTDLNTNYQCANTINGCNCYNQLQKVSSVLVYMTGYVFPYNKISNTSATCVDEKGVTRYQTICQGTPESKCVGNNKEFKPNGCVSDTYNNGFEVKGDRWGDCVEKENTCKYTYAHLTTSDTNASTNFDGFSKLYSDFQSHRGNTPSAYYYSTGQKGKTFYYQAYNKISKNSNTCYDEKNELRYETICSGFTKRDCDTKKGIFTTTCTSEEYNVAGLKIEGMEFGTCSCDASKGSYDTIEECRSGTNSSCGKGSGGCYKTCKSQGYYSTETDCKKSTTYKVTCTKTSDPGDCYKREMQGFLIRYADNEKRTWSCRDYSANSRVKEAHVWLAEILPNNGVGERLKTVEGIQYQDLPDNVRDATETYQYPAGTYYLCTSFENKGQIGTMGDFVSLANVGIYRAMDLVGSAPTHTKCFASEISHRFNSLDCEKSDYNGSYMCHKFTFEKGKLYLIKLGYYNSNETLCKNGD